MEYIIDLAQIIVPGAMILYLAYLLVRSFLNGQRDELLLQMRQKNQEAVLPIRLQAYERVCLLLERIAPENLLPRVSNKEFSARQLQGVLISEIREEYNHNISQQVYMSDEAWMYVAGGVENLISLINESANELSAEASGLDLARVLFEKRMQSEDDALKQALRIVKAEIKELF